MTIRLAVAVLLLLPPTAFAQGNQGPFAGLFGRTPEKIGGDYTLFEVRSGASVQLDNQVLSSASNKMEGVGVIGALHGSASLDRQTTRLRTTARGVALYNEFIQTPRLGATTLQTGGMVTWKVGTRFSVEGGANYIYSPYFQFFPGILPAPAVPGPVTPISPYITGLIENDAVDATAGFTSLYSKRSTLGVSFSRRQTWFRDNRPGDFESNGVRALWTRSMTRDLGIRLGYTREVSRVEALGDGEYLHEFIEAGVDLSRPVSLSRNTTMGFRTESSVIARNGGSRHFRLNGSIDVGHWFTRTWSLSVNASRKTEFLAGFRDPLFSDTVGASLGGLLSPRIELILSAGGGRGYFGIDGEHGSYDTASTSSQLSFALTSKFGVFAQHAFYFYQLPPGVSVLPTTQRLARQALTVGATVWLPVINRERSPSDSR